MMEIYDDILATLGDTPLVRLGRVCPEVRLAAKVESFNPGSSVKDRIGIAMIDPSPNKTVVTPTIQASTTLNRPLGTNPFEALR